MILKISGENSTPLKTLKALIFFLFISDFSRLRSSVPPDVLHVQGHPSRWSPRTDGGQSGELFKFEAGWSDGSSGISSCWHTSSYLTFSFMKILCGSADFPLIVKVGVNTHWLGTDNSTLDILFYEKNQRYRTPILGPWKCCQNRCCHRVKCYFSFKQGWM